MERDDRVTHVGHGPGMTVSSFGRGRVTVPKGQRRGMAKPATHYQPALAHFSETWSQTVDRLLTPMPGPVAQGSQLPARTPQGSCLITGSFAVASSLAPVCSTIPGATGGRRGGAEA